MKKRKKQPQPVELWGNYLNQVIFEVCNASNIDQYLIYSGHRNREISDAKAAICVITKRRFPKITQDFIAQYLGYKDHTPVFYHLHDGCFQKKQFIEKIENQIKL